MSFQLSPPPILIPPIHNLNHIPLLKRQLSRLRRLKRMQRPHPRHHRPRHTRRRNRTGSRLGHRCIHERRNGRSRRRRNCGRSGSCGGRGDSGRGSVASDVGWFDAGAVAPHAHAHAGGRGTGSGTAASCVGAGRTGTVGGRGEGILAPGGTSTFILDGDLECTLQFFFFAPADFIVNVGRGRF